MLKKETNSKLLKYTKPKKIWALSSKAKPVRRLHGGELLTAESGCLMRWSLVACRSEIWLLQSEVRLCMEDTHQISETKYKNNAKYLINSFCIDY